MAEKCCEKRGSASRARTWSPEMSTVSRIINPFTPRASYGDIKVILAFESVDEIVSCDYSNDTLSAALSQGAIYT